MKLQGKNILITGASSGIGKAVALRLAKDKPHLILAARNIDKLNSVKTEVESIGATAEIIKVDVTKDDEIKNLFLEATQNGRILDVVFNNAGLGYINPIYDLKVDEIHKMIDVNLAGMIIVTKYAAEVMTRQKHGHIVMTSSLAGLITLPQWSVYCATKWGITGFADSIRPELKPFNVKITTLHPGAVATEFFDKEKANVDLGSLGGGDLVNPGDVAEEVYEALFTNTKKIKIPRMAKTFSLLYKYLPNLVERQLEKMAKDVEYHKGEEKTEDEPEFSYIKDV